MMQPKRNASMISKDSIIVAVDFGTTYSGVAFYYFTKDMKVEYIETIKSWPGSDNSTSEKVPTEVTYKKGEPVVDRWGYELGPNDTSVRYVKLLLEDKKEFPDFASKASLLQQLENAGKSAAEVAGEYLAKLKVCISEALEARYSRAIVDATDINYVLTVPAVWSDKAKQATLEAAHLGGFPVEKVKTVAEPEAAAVYALSTMQGFTANIGDVFIVCDNGGGTADVITYQVTQLQPLRFKELVEGDGALCGGAFLNIKFEQLLERRLPAAVFREIRWQRPAVWQTAIGHFEHHVKRSFNPQSAIHNQVDHFGIPVPGIADDPANGIEAGFLSVSTNEVRRLFDPLIQKIIGLIEVQRIKAVERKKHPKAVILVGGFSQSPYLVKHVQAAFAKVKEGMSTPQLLKMDVIKSAHTWTAVVRGAVICGVPGNDLVTSRKARRNYGVAIDEDFFDWKHPPHVKYWDPLMECHRARDQMEWFVKKGQTVKSGDIIRHNFYRRVTDIPDSFEEELYYCDADDAPTQANDDRVKVLCSLSIKSDTATLGRNAWVVRYIDEEKSYELAFQLGMKIRSGTTDFDMRTNGKERSKVNAKFE